MSPRVSGIDRNGVISFVIVADSIFNGVGMSCGVRRSGAVRCERLTAAPLFALLRSFLLAKNLAHQNAAILKGGEERREEDAISKCE